VIAESEDFTQVTGGYLAASQEQRGIRLTCYVQYTTDFSEAEVLAMMEDNVLPNLPARFSSTFGRKYSLVVPDQTLNTEMVLESNAGSIIEDADVTLTLNSADKNDSFHVVLLKKLESASGMDLTSTGRAETLLAAGLFALGCWALVMIIGFVGALVNIVKGKPSRG
jgi:hypothetical protein